MINELPMGTYQRYLRDVHGVDKWQAVWAKEQEEAADFESRYPTLFRGTIRTNRKTIIDVLMRNGLKWECTERPCGGYDYYGPWYSNTIDINEVIKIAESGNVYTDEKIEKIKEIFGAKKK